MNHLPLFSVFANDSLQPRWAPVFLDDTERERLERALVWIVATDDGNGRPCALGTGFIVSPSDIVVLTAAHVLTEWIDRIERPTPSVIPEHRLRDLGRRFGRHARLLRAVIHPRGSEPLLCEIGPVGMHADPWEYDVAALSLIPPPELRREMLGIGFAVDIDDVAPGTKVFTAGYSGPRTWQPVERPDGTLGIARFDWDLHVRVSVISEFDENAPGFRNGMYRARFPAEPGMSGGPVFTMRCGDLPGTGTVGVISRDCSAANETWVAPIQDAFGLQLGLQGRDGPVYFCDAVKMGRVLSRGTRAGNVTARTEGSEVIVEWGHVDLRRCGRIKDPGGWRN